MSLVLNISQGNAVLKKMATLIDQNSAAILEVNQKDLKNYSGDDKAIWEMKRDKIPMAKRRNEPKENGNP